MFSILHRKAIVWKRSRWKENTEQKAQYLVSITLSVTSGSVKRQAKGFLLLFALVVTQFGHLLHSPLQKNRVLVDPLKGVHVGVEDFTDLLKLEENKKRISMQNGAAR